MPSPMSTAFLLRGLKSTSCGETYSSSTWGGAKEGTDTVGETEAGVEDAATLLLLKQGIRTMFLIATKPRTM